MSEHQPGATGQTQHASPSDAMLSIAEKVRACMQCGTCTGSCANAHAMDMTPRQLWRLIQLGLKDEIFASRTFWLCSSCYTCTLRCPRGLPLTETMGELKRVAVAEGLGMDKKSALFYRAFLDGVRRYGRVREMELMSRYFIALKSPLAPMRFTSLGLKLMSKGKLSLQWPVPSRRGKLDALYRKAKEVEANP